MQSTLEGTEPSAPSVGQAAPVLNDTMLGNLTRKPDTTMTKQSALAREIGVVVDKMNANVVDSFKASRDEHDKLERLVFLSAERVKIVLEKHSIIAKAAQDFAETGISTMERLREEHADLSV